MSWRSGAGKSTLLHVVGGLDRVTSGEIEIAGRRLDGMSSSALADFRNRSVGFVFQSIIFCRVHRDRECGDAAADPGESRGKAMAAAQEYLEMVGVADRAKHKPAELSGGEQQRVAVAGRLSPSEPRACRRALRQLDSETGERLHALYGTLVVETDRRLLL